MGEIGLWPEPTPRPYILLRLKMTLCDSPPLSSLSPSTVEIIFIREADTPRAIMLKEKEKGKKKKSTPSISLETRTRGPSHLFFHLLLAQLCDEPEAVCSSLVHRMLHVHREDVPLPLAVSLL